MNPTPSVDFYTLYASSKRFLLVERNFFGNLDTVLKADPVCASIIERYDNLSFWLSQIQEGPGTSELEDKFYYWQLANLCQLAIATSSLSGALAKENNELLKKIHNQQLPSLVRDINNLSLKIDTLPENVSTRLEINFNQLNALLQSILNIINNTVLRNINELNILIREFEETLNITLEDNQNTLLIFLSSFEERVYASFFRLFGLIQFCSIT